MSVQRRVCAGTSGAGTAGPLIRLRPINQARRAGTGRAAGGRGGEPSPFKAARALLCAGLRGAGRADWVRW